MLSDDSIKILRDEVDAYWVNELGCHNKYYYDMAVGKEGGHQLGDKVDQLSTGLVTTTHPSEAGFQHKNGKVSPRSMGDFWFKNDNGEWNPINVKTGLVGSEGQPNIVSLKRVMSSIIEHTIDAYYLLMVKFEIDSKKQTLTHNVYLTDILDWLSLPRGGSVVTFNSGPGQTMLKGKMFYDLLSEGFSPGKIDIRKKMELLMNLYLEGEKNLIRDRERDRKKFESHYNAFKNDSSPFFIDKQKQIGLEIYL